MDRADPSIKKRSIFKLSWIFLPLTFLASTYASTNNESLVSELEAASEHFIQDTFVNSNKAGLIFSAQSEKYNFNWHSAKGFVDNNSKTKLTTAHTFRIASNTKTYTAAAAIKLVELNKLKLDKAIDYYLNDPFIAALEGAGYRPKNMTVYELLTHTSGLKDHAQDPRYFQEIKDNPNHNWSPIEQVKLLQKYELKPEGSKAFSYSDTGYVLLGQIIEKQTGLPLANALRELLNYEQLGLNHTWLESKEKQPSPSLHRAHQYYDQIDTYTWDPSFDLHGGGGIVTTSKELGLFLKALMSGRVLKDSESLELMTNFRDNSIKDGYGMGLFAITATKAKGIGHTGFWNTFAFYFEEYDLVVSGAITNTTGIKGTELATSYVDRIETIISN